MKNIIKNLEKELVKLQGIHSNKEEYFNDRTEKWQESDKGESMSIQLEQLEDAISALEGLIEDLKDI